MIIIFPLSLTGPGQTWRVPQGAAQWGNPQWVQQAWGGHRVKLDLQWKVRSPRWSWVIWSCPPGWARASPPWNPPRPLAQLGVTKGDSTQTSMEITVHSLTTAKSLTLPAWGVRQQDGKCVVSDMTFHPCHWALLQLQPRDVGWHIAFDVCMFLLNCSHATLCRKLSYVQISLRFKLNLQVIQTCTECLHTMPISEWSWSLNMLLRSTKTKIKLKKTKR